jgi:LacI family transcriptional regulator
MTTLADIAREASVSRQTVMRVLSRANKETWASSTERANRIRQIAEQLGYRPNAAARATAKGQFHTIGLLLSTIAYRSHLPEALFDGVASSVDALNKNLLVARLPDEVLTDDSRVPRLLDEWCADGMLVNYTSDIPERMIALINGHRVPSIWLNSKQPFDCVRPDDFEAGQRATTYLLELGHRRITYIDYWPGWHYSEEDRRAGYVQAMRQAGLMPRIACERIAYPDRFAAASVMVRGDDRPTAAVVYGNDEASVLIGAAFEACLRVPQDLSVISLASTPSAPFCRQMACLPVPSNRIGAVAVEMLMTKIEKPTKKLKTHVERFQELVGPVLPPAGSV